jgi:hypothetical protein
VKRRYQSERMRELGYQVKDNLYDHVIWGTMWNLADKLDISLSYMFLTARYIREDNYNEFDFRFPFLSLGSQSHYIGITYPGMNPEYAIIMRDLINFRKSQNECYTNATDKSENDIRIALSGIALGANRQSVR